MSRAYVAQGSQARTRRSKLVTSLLSERRLPKTPWDDASIEAFLAEASMMDSNNFLDNVGVGEREARVFSPIVARRHWNLAHGIGRSGDVAAEQPKAAGSSSSQSSPTSSLPAPRAAGLQDMGPALVLPLATGMTSLSSSSLSDPSARRPPPRWCGVDWIRRRASRLSSPLVSASSSSCNLNSRATNLLPIWTPSARP